MSFDSVVELFANKEQTLSRREEYSQVELQWQLLRGNLHRFALSLATYNQKLVSKGFFFLMSIEFSRAYDMLHPKGRFTHTYTSNHLKATLENCFLRNVCIMQHFLPTQIMDYYYNSKKNTFSMNSFGNQKDLSIILFLLQGALCRLRKSRPVHNQRG